MPRQARLDASGTPHHVILQGTRADGGRSRGPGKLPRVPRAAPRRQGAAVRGLHVGDRASGCESGAALCPLSQQRPALQPYRILPSREPKVFDREQDALRPRPYNAGARPSTVHRPAQMRRATRELAGIAHSTSLKQKGTFGSNVPDDARVASRSAGDDAVIQDLLEHCRVEDWAVLRGEGR